MNLSVFKKHDGTPVLVNMSQILYALPFSMLGNVVHDKTTITMAGDVGIDLDIPFEKFCKIAVGDWVDQK